MQKISEPLNLKIKMHNKLEHQNKTAFFIEGGGTKGVYAFGVLKYLLGENPYLDMSKVDLCGGTSVGSYVAAALCLGSGLEELKRLSEEIDLSKLVDSEYYIFFTLCRFLKNGYLYSDTGRREIIGQILNLRINIIRKDLGKSEDSNFNGNDLTFADLKKLISIKPDVYKHFIINTVDINREEQIFMTTLENNFDNIKLIDALLASSSIPVVFDSTTLYHNNGKYQYQPGTSSTVNKFIDGGMSTNNPLDYFLINDFKFKNYNFWVLKFTTEPKYTKIDGTISFFKQIVNFLVTGKNNIKNNIIHDIFKMNTINLNIHKGTLEIYNREEINEIIEKIYQKFVDGNVDIEHSSRYFFLDTKKN